MGKRSASTILIATIATSALSLAAPASALGSQEAEFVSKINGERRARGKNALVVKGDLVSVARAHSAKMASEGRIWHNPNLPNQVKGWIRLGENVGKGPSVTRLHKAFMNSAGHRKNIIGDYNQIGVGVVVRNGTIYVTEVFAKRGSTTQKSTKTAAAKPSSAPSKASAPRPAATTPAAATREPAPMRVEKRAPRTVVKLVRIVGLDAEDLDPATGTAAGF